MTATSTALNSAFTTARDAGKPVWIGKNALNTSGATVIWRDTDADQGAADESNSSFPIKRLHDNSRVTKTKAGSASTTAWILIDAGSGNQITADCWAIEGHNLDSGSATITIRTSDTIDGGTGVINGTIVTLQSSVAVAADRNVKFTDTSVAGRYWEVAIAGSSTTWEITQFWLGVQRQFQYKGTEPSDADARFSSYSETVARSGARQRVSHFSNLRRRSFQWDLNVAAFKTALTSLWTDTEGFSAPCFYCEDPDTDPEKAVFVYVDGQKLERPSVEDTEIRFAATMHEDGPRLEP